jgi:hypothetical protein
VHANVVALTSFCIADLVTWRLPVGRLGNPVKTAVYFAANPRDVNAERANEFMSINDISTVLAQLRTVLDLTNTEIQVAETRVAQARTEAVRRELTQNAANGRTRAEAIEAAIRDLGGFPDVIGPLLGRAAAAVKAMTEQAQPFSEALLGDLALEHQLLDRARYIKALSVAIGRSDIEKLAERLIVAHSATVDWLTTVLAEDALGGPAALQRGGDDAGSAAGTRRAA